MNTADYTNSLANLANSLLKQFGVRPFHSSIRIVDDYIRDKNKILVFLFDGLGKSILEKHLPPSSFLRSHVLTDITSVAPPTTVAATTALLSGRFPLETGWLGWSQYFKECDANVDVFSNCDSATGKPVSHDSLIRKCGHYDSLATLINEKVGKEIASEQFGYPVEKFARENYWLRLFIRSAYKHAHNDNIDEQSFVYAYWPKPDSLMHRYGTDHTKVRRYIEKIDRLIRYHAEKNKDVTTLVIADHGFMDVKWLDIAEHPDLREMLLRPMSLEARTATFFLKPDTGPRFKELFLKYYGTHFELLSRQEVLDREIFGTGRPTAHALSFLGDYTAFAIAEYCLYDSVYKPKKKLFKGHHAGMTPDELLISLIAIN